MTRPDHLAYLRCYTMGTYGLAIPRDTAREMEREGLIEWVPPKFDTTVYAITGKGRRVLIAEDGMIHNVHDRRHAWIGSWHVMPLVYEALTQACLGRTVIYMPEHGSPEAGTLSSFRDGTVWVRFSTGSTAAACNPENLMIAGTPNDGDLTR